MSKLSYLMKTVTAFVGGGVVTYIYVLPHTQALDYCRNYFTVYKRNKEEPLHPNILKRLKDVMRDLKLTEEETNKIKPFNSALYDTMHLGCTSTTYGAILGLGPNLKYLDIEKINIEDIRILGEPIDWTRKDAQTNIESLKLSDEAQRYLLAREVLKLKTIDLIWEAGNVQCASFFTLFSQFLLSDMPKASVYLRRSLRVLVLFVGYHMYGFLYDWHNRRIDENNDDVIAKLGSTYIRGGKEYYEKSLTRNLSFRTLLPMGYMYVTKDGETRTLLRWKSPVLRERLEFFRSKLAELEKHTNT